MHGTMHETMHETMHKTMHTYPVCVGYIHAGTTKIEGKKNIFKSRSSDEHHESCTNLSFSGEVTF